MTPQNTTTIPANDVIGAGRDIGIRDNHSGDFKFMIDGVELLTLKEDGTVERGPAFTTDDESSLKFLAVLNEIFPQWLAAKAKGN